MNGQQRANRLAATDPREASRAGRFDLNLTRVVLAVELVAVLACFARAMLS